MVYLLLLLSIVCEVLATSALKASQSFTRLGPSIVVVLGYSCAFYLMSIVIKTLPIGLVYAIWSGLGIVLISIVGWLVFKQSLDLAAILGLGLIICGVLVIHLFSKSMPH